MSCQAECIVRQDQSYSLSVLGGAMASQTVLQQIKAAERQVRSQVALGIMGVTEACRAKLQNLLGLVRTSASIAQEHCTDVLEYLQSDLGTFSNDERLEIARVTNARYMSLAAGGVVPDGSSTQKNKYVYNYYPEWLWTIITSDDSVDNKNNHQAQFWIKSWPKESV